MFFHSWLCTVISCHAINLKIWRVWSDAWNIRLSGVEVGEPRPTIFYRHHTFLTTPILFVDNEIVIFVSLERRLIHSVFHWTFLPYSGYQSHTTSHTRPSAHSHAWMTPRSSKSANKQIISAPIRLGVTVWTRLKRLKSLIIRYK